ncbi:PEP-CTERM sorting domain-containing protein [Candidatus Thiodictyon syntrophicum]|jgi:hypothetical protein|uniref:Ice-binding protein C-terminal domain-containing protein n=1 Tax=Candidatus Thiodictyon syntrophicum TaxID=1166950 RepID=A0A2K8UAY8_9GAMM|nr:PEP-CTERM sorting domain-containing protein [Candidatus Thiodictyon syntrophicum]AUB82579.1 hypothetical protein THSYN_17595 [Candidatus Thiodictyon syntrophicum]
MNKIIKPFAGLALALTMLSAPAAQASILTPDPANGALVGAPGTIVGWGFSLHNDDPLNYLLVSSATFQTDSAASGTFSDFLGLQSLEVAPLTTVVQAFDLGNQLGIGSYAIPSFASSGTVVSGRLLLTFDLYSRSIDAADFDPDTDLVSSGNVIAADAAVPEPATLLLLGLGAFAIPRRRRARSASPRHSCPRRHPLRH